MGATWKHRLAEAVNNDGRSMRAISKSAGVGVNYLSEIFSKDKVPSIDKLLLLAEELKVSATFILVGTDVSPESEEFLAHLGSMTPEERATMLSLARQLRASRQ